MHRHRRDQAERTARDEVSFGIAFAKSQAAAYGSLPVKGTVFVSIANRDKRAAIFPVKRLSDLGFRVLATEGTAQVLRRNGVNAEIVGKFSDGPGNVVEKILASHERLPGSVGVAVSAARRRARQDHAPGGNIMSEPLRPQPSRCCRKSDRYESTM